MRMRAVVLGIGLSLALLLTSSLPTFITHPVPAFAATGTAILNENSLIAQYALPQPQWFKDNIPFFDSPDATINGVYYYRWDNVRRHLRYAAPGTGYVSTEFSQPVGYAGGYNTINAAAGHFIYESRWLRDPRYLNDYENYWLNAGANHNRQYTEWLADADYNRYLVNGDGSFITGLLPGLIALYNGWNDHYTANVNGTGQGLYYTTPVSDATEYTESSYHSCNFFSGGQGYRPTINAYQYAAAAAISQIAQMAGDSADATTFANHATAIKNAMQQLLWDPNHSFFMQQFTGDSCNQSWANQRATWREEMGYTPWDFNMPSAQDDVAWQYLMSPSNFYAPFGPTTIERQNDFEAEDSATTAVNHADIRSSASASNGKYVGGIDYSDSYVQFAVSAPYAGTYPITVYFANNSGATATHSVIVNGNTGAPLTVSYPNTGAWGAFAPGQKVTFNATLNAGSNTLKFTKGTNWAEIDKITANPYFDQDAIPPTPTPTNDANCCHWDGPSWPYETSQVLMGLANLLDNYPAQSYVTAGNYFTLLKNYAATQQKNGAPYVAEAADGDTGRWIYDARNHSENYDHSTFDDLVISGLVGIRPRADNVFQVDPLAPSSWNYFCLENVPYHGHNMTILWDRDGSHYGHGAGLQIFQDGQQIASQPNLGALSVTMSAPSAVPGTPRLENFAANTVASDEVFQGQSITQQYPQPFASYTFSGDNVWQAVDGMTYYDTTPQDAVPNSRWTDYQSPNSTDYLGVNFGSVRPENELTIKLYADNASNGVVRAPASYDVQYWNGSAWVDVPNQVHSPATPAANDANVVTFSQVMTSQVRVVFTRQPNYYVGVTELESWYPAPASGISYHIINQNSGKLLAVQNASTAPGAQIQQYHDNGTLDHNWQFVYVGNGYYHIVNQNSGLLLGVTNESTADSANVVQFTDNGTPDHNWQLVDIGNGYFHIVNQNSGLLLAVQGASTADSANVQQYHDNGTPDHNWQLVPLNA